MKGGVYSDLKFFQFPEHLAALPRGDARVMGPLHVRIKPVNACNHHCTYCAYHSSPDLTLGEEMDAKDILPWAKMEEIVEDLIHLRVRAVTFSGGGEPFLFPRLAEVVRRLSDAGISIGSLTNGSRLSGELARTFAERATWIRISVDGWDDPSYASYRGTKPGAFPALLENMRAFKALKGRCRLGVIMNVDERNADHVYDLGRQVRLAGADSLKISEVVVSNDGTANAAYHQRLMPSVSAQIDRLAAEFGGPDFELYPAYHGQPVDFAKDYDWCPFLQLLTVIGADQCVYACQDKAYTANGRLGSIRDIRFRDFWMASKERFFRIRPCTDCRHHCVQHHKNQTIQAYLSALELGDHAMFV